MHKLSYPPLSYHDVHLSKIWNHDGTRRRANEEKCKKLSPSPQKTFSIFKKSKIYVLLNSKVDSFSKQCSHHHWLKNQAKTKDGRMNFTTFQKYRQIMVWFPDENSVIWQDFRNFEFVLNSSSWNRKNKA